MPEYGRDLHLGPCERDKKSQPEVKISFVPQGWWNSEIHDLLIKKDLTLINPPIGWER
jgi:hypothetical protein